MPAIFFDSQVCLNGHQITDPNNKSPALGEESCPICGEKTFHLCPNCLREISRYYDYTEMMVLPDSRIPIKCAYCGELFPWALRIREQSQFISKSNEQMFERSRGNQMITIKIFVASSIELKKEREKTVLVVHEVGKVFPYLNLDVVKWETDIPSGSYNRERPQDEINLLLKPCPIVLVLFYSRLGRFTQEEYRLAMEGGKKIFLYFKKGFSPESSEEIKHYNDLIDFKKEIINENNLIFKEYDDIKDFGIKIYKDLILHLKQNCPSPALDDEEVQPNDQEMMTPGKMVDRTENERKNTLWQTMKNSMVKIPARTVLIKDEDSGIEFTEKIKSFRLDKFPVSQDLYEKVMGKEKNNSLFKSGDRPVEFVTWFDAVEFCNRLSDKMGLKTVYTIEGEKIKADWEEKGFRLPSEAEWEFACRAGTTGEWYGEIDKIAWYKNNSNESTQVVGKKEPNPLGLYDMLGNVWEWCWDCYEKNRGQRKKVSRVPENCIYRVRRGGSWRNSAEECSSVYRAREAAEGAWDNRGFRLAMSL
jgi:formylglycine-generating enzyme required for sulfatase activity